MSLLGAGLAILLAATEPLLAQEPAPDADLERLLDQIDPRPDSDLADQPSSKTGASPKPAQRPTVPDEALDSLLEKLGQTRDQPDTLDPTGPFVPGQTPPDPDAREGAGRQPPDVGPDPLDPSRRALDEHLEELTGRIRRKRAPQDPQTGPLSQTIRKIREVEKRLGENETGESVRQRQREIVKDFDQLIQQARQASRRSRNQTTQAGDPGSQPGPNTGNTGLGTPAQRPKTPTAREVIAAAKDEWGHLPPELRAEMENVFNEGALPGRRELIERYYLSINRKAIERRGGSR
jgi:hypothetical protein